MGPYRLVECLGEGGMGVVHLATTADGDLVAVKVLRPWLVGGRDGRDRFEREVATMRRVRGPRVAEVVDADVTGDPPYIVTRYVRGPALDRVVADHGPLRGAALLRLASGLAEALGTVHAAGLVHRDVKPGNVLLADSGPVLIDFGLAHAVGEARLTATGFFAGTPGYVAPETVEGREPTTATDVHGWGATVTYAATGRSPYGTGPDAVVIDRIRRGEHDLAGVPPGLHGLLRRALDPDPARRPGVGELAAEVARLGGPPATLAGPARTTRLAAAPAAAAPPAPGVRWRAAYALLLAAAAAWVALVVAAPYVGAAVLAAWLVLSRTVWRLRTRMHERRLARGPSRADGFVATVGAPWHLLASVPPALAQGLLVAGAGLLAGAALTYGGVVAPRLPYAVGAAFAVLLAWFGPGSARVRRGSRVVVGAAARSQRLAWTLAALLLAAAWALGLWAESYGISWWPVTAPY